MLELTDSQQANVPLKITDKKKHPAAVDGVPEWSSSDEAVAKLEVAEDGMSANVIAVDTGVCQVTVSADADLGEGVKTITGFLDVTVNPGEAAVIELVPGEVTEQPA